MKTENLYYHTVIKRKESLKANTLNFFLTFSSWSRTFVENFTRRSMGERYFSFGLCVFLTFVLFFVPFAWGNRGDMFGFITHNLSWYSFLAAYMYAAVQRRKEIKREPGTYDFEKYSLSAGVIIPELANSNFFAKQKDRRMLAVFCEPAIFFLAGLVLAILQQPIGVVLMISAIFYSASWAGQYYEGDQFVLDTIDEMIVNQELVNSFVHGMSPDETKGFEFYGTRPNNYEFRRKVADFIMDDEPAASVS